MGQLPLARVTVARPFLNAGIDYVGPFEIKSGNTGSKTTTKTEHHVGAGMVAFEKSRETYIGTQRLHNECTVFQAELCGIDMAVNWIQNQLVKTYAIHVDSKAALLVIANKLSTHPIAVDIRRKTMEIRTVNSITFHWIKGHTGLEGNERADYLARTTASYNPIISYDAIPVSRGKRLLEDYNKIWNGTCDL
jgi:ribonuclease HI